MDNDRNSFDFKCLSNDVEVEYISPDSKIWIEKCKNVERLTRGVAILIKVKNKSQKIFNFITSKNTLLVTTHRYFIKNSKNKTEWIGEIDGGIVFGVPKHNILKPTQIGYYIFVIRKFKDYFPTNIMELESQKLFKIQARITNNDDSNKKDAIFIEITCKNGKSFE